jgi:hypothetical protein
MEELKRDDIRLLKKKKEENIEARMFCRVCGKIFSIDFETTAMLMFMAEHFEKENVNWDENYIETNFCLKCDEKEIHVKIKKIPK